MSELRSSQRRLVDRLLWVAALSALGALLVLAGVGVMAFRMRGELAESSRMVLEEQRITDQVVAGIMRQLVFASSATSRSPVGVRDEFEVAGASVQGGLRAYLFRPLSPDERHQIERIKEEHLLLEVMAFRVSRLTRAADPAIEDRARGDLASHAAALLGSIEGFSRTRGADLQGVFARQATAVRRLLLGGGAALLLTGLLAGMTLTRFTRRRVREPLDKLAVAASRIGAGEANVKVSGEHDLEFFGVAASFNAMVAALATARSTLERRNEELEAALAQVQAAQDTLVQAEKLGALGRMTAGLAHELNSPLASVLGFSQLLAADLAERGQIPPEELATRYVRPLTREASRAHQLVRSLLQFSRRAGTEIGPVSLQAAMALVVDLRRHAFEQAGLRLMVADVPDIAVTAEQQRLQGVFLNLINNAFDAMVPRGAGALHISATAGEGTVTIRFEDDGPGMEQPEHVFEPFYTTKPAGEGTGLGLALVNRFVSAFGGTIRAENRPEGGARFEVTLVAVEDASTSSPTVPGDGLVRRGQEGRRHVLVVEDEAELRRLAGQVLARLSVEVHLAGSAAEARAILATQPIHAIVSDVRMPGESGISLYAWVQEHHAALSDRFLFVTGDVHADDVAGLADEKPHAFLQKPYDLREYLTRVQGLLDR